MKIKDLSVSYGSEIIFDNVNIIIPDNEKIGIIGVNGAGKTTLFKILLNRIDYHGNIKIKNNLRIDWLPQVVSDEVPNMDISVMDYLLSARPIKELEEELGLLYSKLGGNKDSDIYKKISKVEKRLEYYNQYGAEAEMFKIAKGMNISDEMLLSSLKELSGGEKSKVAFAHLLYSKPDIILLDEPTNHLDIETREYVINYLKRYKGSIFVISHDIEFLNDICTKILYLDKRHHNFELFDGNYDKFKKVYEARLEDMKRKAKIEEEEIKKLRDIVLLYSNSSGNRKRMAQDREKKLNKLLENRVEVEKDLKKVKLRLDVENEGANIPLEIDNICFSYDGKKPYLINKIKFNVYRGDKFLIVGENGVGKSTLLKLIVKKLDCISGSIKYDLKTSIAYYAQELEILDNKLSIIDNFSDCNMSEREIRSLLGRFLFYGDDVFKLVEVLSPGERARVALAKIMTKRANMLILDEPTNHLDPETQSLIADVFKDYNGTMIIVSHNIDFVEKLNITRLLILPSGKEVAYDANIVKHYKELNNKKVLDI